ncbi:Phytochrome-like protein cph2 [compost metagenome]
MLNSAIDQAIIKGYLMLADSLDIQVIAEGVETRAQMEYLRAQGCAVGQGFWYCRPLPLAELRQFVLARAGQGGRP